LARTSVVTKRARSQSEVPVSRFTQTPVIIYADDAVRDAAKLMRGKQVGSIIVAEKRGGEPVGILTEWDLLTRVVAAGRDIQRTRVREVMSSPLLKIDAHAKVGDAIRLMLNRGIRRLAVMENGVLVGTVTQSQIVGNKRRSSAALPIVEKIRGHTCPYCNSNFGTRTKLSQHIKQTHRETELLEIEAKSIFS